MSLIIKRSTTNGSSDLPRVSFQEPAPTPRFRLSALEYQGSNGDSDISNLKMADGNTFVTPVNGDPVKYRVASNGVPGIRFDASDDENASDKIRPTMYLAPSGNRPPTRSLFTVFRVFEMATAIVDPENLSRNDYLQLVGTSSVGNSTIFLTSVTDIANGPNRICCAGGSGRLYGPNLPADGKLHTACMTFNPNDAILRFYVDGIELGSGPSSEMSNGFIVGYSYSGGDFDIMESATYDETLTASQVLTKHKHYESLYQFQA